MLDDLQKGADIIQKLAATAAFVIGGFWVWMNYRRSRTHVRRLQPLLSGEIIEGPAGRHLLVSIEIRNPGQSEITLQENGALLVRPLFAEMPQLAEPVAGEEAAFGIVAYRTRLEPGIAWHEQKLISVPDATIHAFQMRLRVLATGDEALEEFTVTAVAVAKRTSDTASRSE
jgi:hypothetical protein